MTPGFTPAQVRRSLLLSIVDGGLWAVMVGASESFMQALAVELGHQDTALALLVTVPLLLGALSQLCASALATWLGGRRRLVGVGALLQGLTLLGLWAIASHEVRAFWPLLLVRVLYWVSGAVIGPAWNAWMAALTVDVRRERYFAWRNLVVNLVLVVAFLGAGAWLGHAQRAGAALPVFALLQLVGLVARLGSTGCLVAQSDLPPAPVARVPRRFGLALRTSRWNVAVYLGLLQFGAHVAIPFFTPYMLRTLHLTLDQFAWLVAASILGKALSFPLWARLVGRIGLRAVLFTSGLGVALVPTLWTWVSDLGGLLAVQVLSGAVWAGLELTSFQLLLESAEEEARLEFLSLQSSLVGVLSLLGSLVGSALLERAQWTYTQLFLLSGLARCLPLILLTSAAPSGARHVRRWFFRVLSVRPGGGALREPALPLESDEHPRVDTRR